MRWKDLPLSPDARMLRQFAALWIVFFGTLALWQHFGRGHTTAALALGALAVTLGPLGLVRPMLLRPVFVAWMVLAFPIGWAVSTAVLGLLFYGVFMPLGLVFRLMGRDALDRRSRAGAATCWKEKRPAPGPSRYFRQY
jgi:hypothetical protein